MATTPLEPVRVEVSRDLRLLDVVGLGVGAMVGAGVFVLLAPATQASGLSVLIALGISGLVVLLSALSYAELASFYPTAGGGYVWASKSLPPPSGFLAGWIGWAGHSIAIALSAVSLSAFALFGVGMILEVTGSIKIDPFLSQNVYVVTLKVVAFLIILCYLSSAGTKRKIIGRKLPWFSALKIILIGAFLVTIFLAFFWVTPDTSAIDYNFLGIEGWAGIPLVIGFMFVAFEGYEIIALSALEIRNPKKTIPRGILISIGLVVLLYILLSASLLFLAQGNCIGNLGLCTVAGPRSELSLPFLTFNNLGLWAGLLLVVTALIAMTTAVGNNLSSATRLSFLMAQDGQLSSRLIEKDKSTKIPNRALLASSLIAIFFVMILDIPQLAITASILYLLLFSLVNVSLMATRRHNKEFIEGFKVPLVPLVPIIGIVVNIALAIYLFEFPIVNNGVLPPGRIAWTIILLWITIGLFYHFFSGGKQMVTQIRGRKSLDISDIISSEEKSINLKQYRILVPLKNLADTNIVRFGANLAKVQSGELSLLNVVEIPRNLPPKAIRYSYVSERIKGFEKLTRMIRKDGIDSRASVKIGHKVYEIIIDTLSEEDVNLLILGWKGGREAPGRILGSNIDYIVATAPCDVVLIKTRGFKEKFQRMLMVTGPSFSLEGLSDIAIILAKNAGAEIRILVVGSQELEVEKTVETIQPFIEKCISIGVKVNQKKVIAKDIEKEIKMESTDSDLVLVSSPRSREMYGHMLSPMEQRLARSITKPVVLYRRALGRGPAS